MDQFLNKNQDNKQGQEQAEIKQNQQNKKQIQDQDESSLVRDSKEKLELKQKQFQRLMREQKDKQQNENNGQGYNYNYEQQNEDYQTWGSTFQSTPGYKIGKTIIGLLSKGANFIKQKSATYKLIKEKLIDKLEQENQKQQNQKDEQYCSPQNQQMAKQILQKFQKKDTNREIQMDYQIKKLIRAKYFSVKAQQSEQRRIACKIFYYPSSLIIKVIKKYIGLDINAVLHKCVVLKHGDILFALGEYVKQKKKNDQQIDKIRQQVSVISNKLVPWGNFFLDIKKLSQRSLQTYGGANDTTYNIQQFDLTFRISKNGVVVKYKGNQINHFQMKNKILSELAIQQLTKKATRIYFQYLKTINT